MVLLQLCAFLDWLCYADCRVLKHTPMQKDGPSQDTGLFALLFAEHAGRGAQPKCKREHIDMWKTKVIVDLALENVPALYPQPVTGASHTS